jgi:hypothetical protein
MPGRLMHQYHQLHQCNRCIRNSSMLMHKPQQNFLDMIPVRNVGEFNRDGEKITLLVPKFKSPWMRKWLIPQNRSKHFRIHLDEMGSKVWNFIDGERNTNEICLLLNDSLSENVDPDNSIELRVTRFLSQLYKNRFIVFK